MTAFLGYSLVENVGYYYRHSDDVGMLQYYYFLAARYREKYEKAKKELDKVTSSFCLFVFLMVSFTVQKILSLIRSHCFTCVFIVIILGGGSNKILL